MANRIFISPESRGGGHGPYIGKVGVYERDVCHDIASLLSIALTRNNFEPIIAEYGSTMKSRVDWANANKVNYYICIHTNAGGGTGAECLYYNHPVSIRANQLVYDELIKLYPSKRGIKDYSHFYENANTTMVSCYPEIAFHDNVKDVEFILNNKVAIAEALCKGICAFFGVSYIAPSTIEDKTDELKAEIKRLEEEIATRAQQTQELGETILELREEIKAKDLEIEEIKSKLNDSEYDDVSFVDWEDVVTVLEQQVRELKEELVKTNSKVTSLNTALEVCENKASRYKLNMEEAKDILSTVIGKLS